MWRGIVTWESLQNSHISMWFEVVLEIHLYICIKFNFLFTSMNGGFNQSSDWILRMNIFIVANLCNWKKMWQVSYFCDNYDDPLLDINMTYWVKIRESSEYFMQLMNGLGRFSVQSPFFVLRQKFVFWFHPLLVTCWNEIRCICSFFFCHVWEFLLARMRDYHWQTGINE